MDNLPWGDDAYYHYASEDTKRHTCDYKLSQLNLEKGKKFKYIFDFGDEWTFQCKVLQVLDENTPQTTVIKIKGKAPEQYPDYEDYDDYEDSYEDMEASDVDISPELYEASFRYRQTKLWKKLYDTEMFAVQLSNGETGYCTVMGNAGEHIALALYIGQNGWNSFEKLMNNNDFSPSGMFDIFISHDCIQCELVCKADMPTDALEKVQAYAKANGISFRGKNSYPNFVRYAPYTAPCSLADSQDQKFITEALLASIEVSEKLENNKSKSSLGFDDVGFSAEMPFLKLTENGWIWNKIKVPEKTETEYPVPKFKNSSKFKKLEKRDNLECEVVYLQAPVIPEDSEIPQFPAILLTVNTEDNKAIPVDPICDYDKNADKILKYFTENLLKNKFCPKSITVRDKRTEMLLKDFCDKCGIIMIKTKEFSCLDDLKNRMLDMPDDENMQIQTMFDMLNSLDKSDLSTIPVDILKEIMNVNDIPQELKSKLEDILR